MNGQKKFPRGQGRPINVKRARAEQIRWKKNPNNEGMTDTFDVDVSLMINCLNEFPEASGIEFCNGMNDGEYAPVMAAVTEEGKTLAAFNSESRISLDEFNSCRNEWKERYKGNLKVLQFFYLGEESIRQNVEDFDVIKYEACFAEKADGKDTGILLGYSMGIEKDPGIEGPDTALNVAGVCPPLCEEDE